MLDSSASSACFHEGELTPLVSTTGEVFVKCASKLYKADHKPTTSHALRSFAMLDLHTLLYLQRLRRQ